MGGLDHQTGFDTGILSALSDSSLRPLQFNLAVASLTWRSRQLTVCGQRLSSHSNSRRHRLCDEGARQDECEVFTQFVEIGEPIMNASSNRSEIAGVVTKVQVRSGANEPFGSWQARLSTTVASFPGFVNAEVIPPTPPLQRDWVIVQRFRSPEFLRAWRESAERRLLWDEAKDLIDPEESAGPRDEDVGTPQLPCRVTDVITTHLKAGKDDEYLKWAQEIQQAQARFPGYQGIYIQPPSDIQQDFWTTLLRFDTLGHLQDWLASSERLQLLQRAEALIDREESHQLMSSFAGWFPGGPEGVTIPAVWKQTMLVLLVLFPLVMLEMRWLNPLFIGWNPALATFIGNALTVSLLSWPLMPIAIRGLGWWLSPKRDAPAWTMAAGLGSIAALYLLEVIVLWRLM